MDTSAQRDKDARRAMIAHDDWTYNTATGRANDSRLFWDLTHAVATIIEHRADRLIRGEVEAVAHSIVSALAHTHHLAPLPERPVVTVEGTTPPPPPAAPERRTVQVGDPLPGPLHSWTMLCTTPQPPGTVRLWTRCICCAQWFLIDIAHTGPLPSTIFDPDWRGGWCIACPTETIAAHAPDGTPMETAQCRVHHDLGRAMEPALDDEAVEAADMADDPQ